MIVARAHAALVEHRQDAFRGVAGAGWQAWDLDYDDVVRETADELAAAIAAVRPARGYGAAVIVGQGPAVAVGYGAVGLADGVAKQVDGNDVARHTRAVLDIGGVGVLPAEIFAESVDLGLVPHLLQLYAHRLLRAVGCLDHGRVVQTVDAEILARLAVARLVDVLVSHGAYVRHLATQQSREENLGGSLIFH